MMSAALIHAIAVLPGRDVPGRLVTNDEFAELHAELCANWADPHRPRPAPCAPGFPEDRAGVIARTVLDESWTARDMAVAAARRIVETSGIDPERIALVIVATIAAEDPVPALAVSVHGALLLHASAPAFDVVLGCAGFVAAIDLATRFLATEREARVALVIGADTMLRAVDAADRSSGVLFGDAAGAVLVEARRSGIPCRTSWTTIGGQWRDIRIGTTEHSRAGPPYRLVAKQNQVAIAVDERSEMRLTMNGKSVFRDVVRMVPTAILQHLERIESEVAAVRLFALHQANARMLSAIRSDERIACDDHQLPIRIGSSGNTSSASIPLVLADAVESRALRDGDTVALCGFGAGLAITVSTLQFTS